MSIPPERYQICQRLDQPRRVIGLPMGEFVMLVVIGGLGLISHHAMAGLLSAAGAFITLRTIKKGRGSGWLVYTLHWLVPTLLGKLMLPSTPPSCHRYYRR